MSHNLLRRYTVGVRNDDVVHLRKDGRANLVNVLDSEGWIVAGFYDELLAEEAVVLLNRCNAFREDCGYTPEPEMLNKYPLRKIVGYTQEMHGTSTWYEVLSCGHEVHEANGIYGRENRMSRRCVRCGPRPAASSGIQPLPPKGSLD